MRKLFCCLLAVVMLLAFIGCTSDAPTKETGVGGNTTSAVKKEDTFGLNDTAVFKDLKFTATEIKQTNGVEFFEPEEGNVFVGVKFTIENTSNEEQTISSILLFEGYVDDVKCEYSISAACAFEETLDGSLAPGKKLIGWYALEVPEGWKTIELNVQSNWLSNSSANFVFENK